MKKLTVILILIAVFGVGCRKAKHSTVDHITLTWADNPRTTQTITWRTDTLETTGEVRVAAAADSANIENMKPLAEDSSAVLKTSVGAWRIHSVTIKNLEPGTKYCYKIAGDTAHVLCTFSTEAKEVKSFKFLVFGDSQSGEAFNPDYDNFEKTIRNAYSANKESKFFINMGDLVEKGGLYYHWIMWFNATRRVINKLPAMPIVGNHETYIDNEETTSPPYNFTRQFRLPQNGPDNLKGEVYSWDYGDVHFVVLNSQVAEEKNFVKGMLHKECEWLRNDLENNKDKKWKVVMFHKTPFYNKAYRSNDLLKDSLEPIIDKYHVDLVLNGHDHGVSWTYPIKADTFAEKPSQGTIYYVTGRSGNKTYPDLSKKIWDAFFYNSVKSPVYIVAEVNAGQFKLTAFNQDTTPVDTLIIDKANDVVVHGHVNLKVPDGSKEPAVMIYGRQRYCRLIDGKLFVPADSISAYFGFTRKDYKTKNMVFYSKDSKE